MSQIKQFEIILDDNREEFFAGETINGNVFLSLEEPLRITNFAIYFEGLISSRFGRRGRSERLGDDNIYHFTDAHITGLKTICEHDYVLIKDLDDPLIEHVLVEPGSESYSFHFRLHPEFPSTFDSNWGTIRYWLKCSIEARNDLEEQISFPVTIKGIVDANRPIYKDGFSGTAYKTYGISCFSSSNLEITGRIDRVCYLPGDTILIDAYVDNCTNKRLKCLKAKLFQKIRYHYKKKTLIEEKLVAKVVSPSIPKQGQLVWKQQPFQVPHTPPNMYCELIEVKHMLRLQVNRLYAEVPIVIGTVPYNKHVGNEHLDAQLPNTSRPNGRISDPLRSLSNDCTIPLLIKEEEFDDADETTELNRCSTY